MPTPSPLSPWQLGRLHETDRLKQISELLRHPDILSLDWKADYSKRTATVELVKDHHTLQILSKADAFHIHLIPHTYHDHTDQSTTPLTQTSSYIAGKDPDTHSIQLVELTNMTDQVELTLTALQHLEVICRRGQYYDPFDL